MPLRMFCVAAFALLLASQVDAADEQRPNIVVILADDFGVGDIQAHYPENKIATPHLDKLVRQGMSFTDAHSGSAVCTPTRYGLLTGRYCWRTRLQEWVLACYEPPLIAADRLTLPAMLKQQGYHTACVGKWHLGWDWPGEQKSRMVEARNSLKNGKWDYSKPIAAGPTTRGFDEYFGTHVPNFPPFTFIENNRTSPLPTSRYRYDASEGVVMPRSFDGQPMAPGWRFDQILPTITERAVEYIHRRAKAEQPFFLYFSMTSPHEPVVPSEQFAGKSGIAPIADFVMQTDWSAGQVLKALDEAGVADNTLVLFTADNGHSHYTGWNELVAAGHQPSGPYRGHKGDIWEGGHRVPLVVRWPGHIAADTSSHQLVCLTDVMATCAELVGGDLPPSAAEDSLSFLPAALGKTAQSPRGSLVSHSVNGEFAYREGPWKLVFKMVGANLAQSRGKPTVVELYNLDDDLAETRDVAKQHADVVVKLTKNLQSLVDRGTSRPGPRQANDAQVDFDLIQTARWASPTTRPDP
ncbi:MAG: arylsulfatase [Pirellulaceae bacterium]